MWTARVLESIAPALEEVRTDAKETPLERAIRVASRPANDAVGTTTRDKLQQSLLRVKRDARDAGKRQQRLIETVAGKVDKGNATEFKRVIGIDAKQLGSSISADIDRFRTENTDLITSIPNDMIDQVSEVVDDAWSKGQRVEQLRASIQERFDVTKSRADLIARDQTLKLNSQLAKTRAQAAGLTRYVWTISNDERVRGNPAGLYPNPSKTGKPRPDHFHLDGQEFRYDQPPIVDETSGRRANPGEDYQCRCTAAPILDFLEGNADDPGDTGTDE